MNHFAFVSTSAWHCVATVSSSWSRAAFAACDAITHVIATSCARRYSARRSSSTSVLPPETALCHSASPP